MESSFRDPGIILRTQVLRESDLVLSILTREHGRISAFVRGARKSQRRFMGGIDIFDCGLYTFERSKHDHLNLKALEERKTWLKLRENLQAFSLASCCVESTQLLIMESAPDGGALFEPLYRALSSLNQSDDVQSREVNAIFYLLQLLDHGGVAPQMKIGLAPDNIRAWWQEMLTAERPIAPADDISPKESLQTLIRYMEELVGHELHTRHAFL